MGREGYALERKNARSGEWKVISLHGRQAEANAALDEAVGRGEGTFTDFRVVSVGGPTLLERLTHRN